MVPGAAGSGWQSEKTHGLTEPTFWGVLMTGLPGFLREGFLPLGAFYAGLRARRRSRPESSRLGARLGPDLPLRAPRRARRAARPDLARLRRGAVDRRARRPQRDRLPRPAGAARGGLGPRVRRSPSSSAGRSPARSPAPGTRSRAGSKESADFKRVYARRVGRLGRVLPRAAARSGSAVLLHGSIGELPRGHVPDRDAGDAPAARVVGALRDPRPGGHRAAAAA